MRRRQPCFIATEDDLIASGLQPDRHGLKQGLWEHSLNVYFQQGKVARKKPAADAFDLGSDPIRGIGELRHSDGGRWLWAGANGTIARWAFGAHEVIESGYGTYRAAQSGGLHPTIYDFTPYGNWMIYNDGIAPMIYQDAMPPVAYDGEVPQGAMRYMKFRNMMMASHTPIPIRVKPCCPSVSPRAKPKVSTSIA